MIEEFINVYTNDVDRVVLALVDMLSQPSLEAFLSGSVEPVLSKRAIQRFHDEGDDAVGSWAPLSDATVAIRQSLGYPGSHPINVRTGELESYITQSDATTTADSEAVVLTYPGAEPESPVLYDKLVAAQTGGIGKSGRSFPARPVLGLSDTDVAQIHTELEAYLFGIRL